MTTVVLVRHALCDPVGRSLAGRRLGVRLNDEGHRQAGRLAERLERVAARAVYSSPLERARETADAIAQRLGVQVREEPGLTEIDFGDWTGRTFESLRGDPAWDRFNTVRSYAEVPGGESMLAAQARAVSTLDRLHAVHPGETIIAVSHGDVIGALLAYYAGIPLDLLGRLEIAPASASTLVLGDGAPRITTLNETVG